MQLEQLFTTYWSQVTLLLLGIGYFIKRLFDQKSKKLEINHTVFQTNRLNAFSNFLTAYAKTEQMWRNLPTSKIIGHELSANEIDDIIDIPMNELKKSVLELNIYFDDNIHSKFRKILEGFLNINDNLSRMWSNPNEEALISNSSDLYFFKKEIFKDNNKLLNEIYAEVRKIYKS